MTPYEFIGKWRASALKERSAAQEHFIDLCRLLGEPTPAEADLVCYWFEKAGQQIASGKARRAGPRCDEFDPGWREPPSATGCHGHTADLRGVERRAVGDRRGGALVHNSIEG